MLSEAIIEAVEGTTKKWAKQRKAEERQASAAANRRQALVRTARTSLKDAVFWVMRDAYIEASDNETISPTKRQMYYPVRRRIQQYTDEELTGRYFTSNLLKLFFEAHPELEQHWDIVSDPRGHLVEPHTDREVPLGTIAVRRYLGRNTDPGHVTTGYGRSVAADALYPTHGPAHRFSAVLFVEKEGFLPIFQKVDLANRYDIAIMSTKGMSVVASRALVDELCGKHGIPLLVLRDFDVSGFSIMGTLTKSNDAYAYRNTIEVHDLGLRLADVRQWQLEEELVRLSSKLGDPTGKLTEHGATPEEIAFLTSKRSWQGDGRDRRVELNAFAPRQLIAFIEGKLKALGIRKLIPDAAVLNHAYRRVLFDKYIADRELYARRYADSAQLPSDLRENVCEALEANPGLPWDRAIREKAWPTDTTRKDGSDEEE